MLFVVRNRIHFVLLVVALLFVGRIGLAGDGNRLTYLDDFVNPYWVGLNAPKLVTPQWFGEPGVDAVFIFSIDDMRATEKYESYLRPILDRLKKIYGHAPVSIMTCKTPVADEQHQTWLKEGLSLEVHTVDHPCPLFQKNDFADARRNYEDSIDLMYSIPNNRPVAFRMPCYDSLNTLSPRFFAELFNGVTAKGHFLTLDSSISNITTPSDPFLPRELVLDEDGGEKFRKYIPTHMGPYANWIEDYPYPYVIDRLCWEFPSMVPDDWTGQNYHGTNNPATYADWAAALEVVVLKQGQFSFTFHPYGWIDADLMVRFIDHAVDAYGSSLRFVTFAEIERRMNEHLLAGHALRAANGQDNGVRVLDIDADGYMDVVIGNETERLTRIWNPKTETWLETGFPVQLVDTDENGERREVGARFGVLQKNGYASFVLSSGTKSGVWHFQREEWIQVTDAVPEIDGHRVETVRAGQDRGVRLRDVDGDGVCEWIVGNAEQNDVFSWDAASTAWRRLGFGLPLDTQIVTSEGKDAGLRFADIDEDGSDDVLVSNAERYSAHLFSGPRNGWSRVVVNTSRDTDPESSAKRAIPSFVRADGTNNGVWIKDRHIWLQNEETGRSLSQVSFTSLLEGGEALARSPKQSLASMVVRPGFRVELMAAEPLVMDPVNMEWGSDGKLWVVEMADYPLGLDDQGKPGGRVRYLEDRDGDGQYDRSTLFLDEIPFPTSVLPWGKGVLVTAAPDVFYAEDTDGDGRADRRETLYTGFEPGNQQHRVNGLRWGLDNWVYIANGDSGGVVTSKKTGERVNIRGRDLRVRPDTGELDAQSGQSQYGRERDDWGNWFGCSNPNQGWHFALADHYTRRNSHIAPPRGRVYLSDDRVIYPIGRVFSHFAGYQKPLENHPNFFTSACGIAVYRDDLFGESFQQNIFVSEPIHNLLHRRVLVPEGVTFTSQRGPGEESVEFLASSDSWFRPTTARTGPDGALWVADMYRFVLEHPEWIDDEFEKTLFLRAGHDKGRLYRVVPVDAAPREIPRLSELSVEELVAALDSPSGWQRDTVHRLLVRRGDPAAVIPLRTLLLTRHTSLALARLHAMCILDGLKALPSELLLRGLRDESPGVRRHAVRIAESLLDSAPELAAGVLELTDDEDLFARQQVAYSLGEWNNPRAGEALGRMAIENENQFITAAVLSSSRSQLGAFLRVLTRAPTSPKRSELLLSLVTVAVKTVRQDDTGLVLILDLLQAPAGLDSFAEWQYDLLVKVVQEENLKTLRARASGALRSKIDGLQAAFDASRKIVLDTEASTVQRAALARLLGKGPAGAPRDLGLIGQFLTPSVPAVVQLDLIRDMKDTTDDRIATTLIAKWTGFTPQVRAEAFDVVLADTQRTHEFFAAVESDLSLVAGIDQIRRDRLIDALVNSGKPNAKKILEQPVKKDRAEIVKQFRAALEFEGDPDRGRGIFEAKCSKCHRLGGIGNNVGPDLAKQYQKTPEDFLVAILDPNRAVEEKFIQYVAVTADGRVLTGIIASETGNSITLVTGEGKEEVILREELQSLTRSGISQMPEGLEADLDPQKFADLIAYLIAGRFQAQATYTR